MSKELYYDTDFVIATALPDFLGGYAVFSVLLFLYQNERTIVIGGKRTKYFKS